MRPASWYLPRRLAALDIPAATIVSWCGVKAPGNDVLPPEITLFCARSLWIFANLEAKLRAIDAADGRLDRIESHAANRRTDIQRTTSFATGANLDSKVDRHEKLVHNFGFVTRASSEPISVVTAVSAANRSSEAAW